MRNKRQKKKTKRQISYLTNKVYKALSHIGISLEEAQKKIINVSSMESNENYLQLRRYCYDLYESDIEFRNECNQCRDFILTGYDININDPEKYKIAIRYLLDEMPFFIDTPAVLCIPTSMFIYHQTPYFINYLYNYMSPKITSIAQGFLQVVDKKRELPTITLKHLDLQVDIDESVPQYIVSDKTKLHRILLNLLGNAIKFTKSGHITIEVKCLHDDKDQVHLQFCVADTGIGIPLELQNKVFDRFFRVSPSYKGTYKGHGVGLHIAQSYVTLLGGHIALTSQDGVGTTFYFDLTCKIGNIKDITLEQPPKPPQGESAKPPALPASKFIPTTPDTTVDSNHGLHLLLVEDNSVALKIAEIMVSKAGYRFTSAVDGEQALTLATSGMFDIIITDIGLPGISGHEFTRRVRQLEARLKKTPVPIIGLTAHARESAKDECLEAGMNDVFTKPMSVTMLQTIVNQWVLPAIDDNPHIASTLGADLPSSEKELFKLDIFPLLDIKSALESVGNESMLREILHLLHDDIIKDSNAIEKAYTEKNWEAIEKLAHKLKGGAVYCGTIKLKYACQYLERYQKAGHTTFLEGLYQQLARVLKETQQGIEQWLNR